MTFHFPLYKLMQEPYDVVACTCSFCYLNGVSLCSFVAGHRVTLIQLKCVVITIMSHNYQHTFNHLSNCSIVLNVKESWGRTLERVQKH